MPDRVQEPTDIETPEEAADLAAGFILDALWKAVGMPDYQPCDGTETWEGDVSGTVIRILKAARVLNDEMEVAQHVE